VIVATAGRSPRRDVKAATLVVADPQVAVPNPVTGNARWATLAWAIVTPIVNGP
jgi:ABC-type sulfate transport system substrate-binding protein